MLNDYTTVDIDRAVAVLDAVRRDAIADPCYGFTDGWLTFMKKMRVLTPQSSGARMQNYIFSVLGWTRVPASTNRGDVVNSLGQYFEVKVTVISTSNSCANIVQIRLWQQVSGHHIFVVDTTNQYRVTHFTLSKYDMQQEVGLCGASAHGTREANRENENVEWAIRIAWKESASVYQRWMSKYKQDSLIAYFGTDK